jgi:hypothetical protein
MDMAALLDPTAPGDRSDHRAQCEHDRDVTDASARRQELHWATPRPVHCWCIPGAHLERHHWSHQDPQMRPMLNPTDIDDLIETPR